MDFSRAADKDAAAATPRATCCPVIELRQYTLHPGQRDSLIALFDREFVETQEATGMRVIAQFRDLDRPDVFTWLRGFPDMPTRTASLGAFYGEPVWAAHRAAANATMVSTDNVRLLRPSRGLGRLVRNRRRHDIHAVRARGPGIPRRLRARHRAGTGGERRAPHCDARNRGQRQHLPSASRARGRARVRLAGPLRRCADARRMEGPHRELPGMARKGGPVARSVPAIARGGLEARSDGAFEDTVRNAPRHFRPCLLLWSLAIAWQPLEGLAQPTAPPERLQYLGRL
ncbi:MAG: hypothetical protein DMF79_15470 [Acidobacteria bacterium]|nr:MAG: hypothetical protein DMF79_15470 [Acidobacteriota bacterium]